MTSLQSLTGFDWFLLALVLLSSVAAFRKGIIRVVFSLGGVLVGLVVAAWNYGPVAAHLRPFVSSVPTAQALAFFAIVFVITIAVSLLARLARRAVSTVGLGFVDRLLGAAFGFLRGVLLGVVVMMAVTAFTPRSSLLAGSRLAPFFLSGAHAVSFVLPLHFRQQFAAGATRLLRQSPEIFRPRTLPQSM